MSYTKNTWETGDTITAEKLNHIENGVENNNDYIVNILTREHNVEMDVYIAVFDKPISDIFAAYNSGKNIILVERKQKSQTGFIILYYTLYEATENNGSINYLKFGTFGLDGDTLLNNFIFVSSNLATYIHTDIS